LAVIRRIEVKLDGSARERETEQGTAAMYRTE
jgi:hypothetical protein